MNNLWVHVTGDYILVMTGNGHILKLIDKDGNLVWETDEAALAWKNMGNTLWVSNKLIAYLSVDSIKVVNPFTSVTVAELPMDYEDVDRFMVDELSGYIILVTREGRVIIYDDGLKAISEIDDYAGKKIGWAGVSPNREYIALAVDGVGVVIHKLGGEKVAVVNPSSGGENRPVSFYYLRWSRDGKYVATTYAFSYGSFSFPDKWGIAVISSKDWGVIYREEVDRIVTVSDFSPDGRMMAYGVAHALKVVNLP